MCPKSGWGLTLAGAGPFGNSSAFEGLVVEVFGQGPGQSRFLGLPQVVSYRRVRDAQRGTDLAAGEALAQGESQNVSNLSHGETGSGQVNLLGVMSEAGCLPSFTSRQPYTTSVGVYENPGMAVRIRPEQVYEISRNPQLNPANLPGTPLHEDDGIRLGGPEH